MSQNKKVSVIISAYNEEKFIGQAIEAYKSQNYKPMEIIVAVDNSSDKTFDIAEKLADKVLSSPNRLGVSAARNEGARVATGEILIFSDVDSYLSPNGIQKIVSAMDNSTIGTPLGRAGIVGFKGKLFFFFKNWIHILGIYQGFVDGVMVCGKDGFTRAGGFDSRSNLAEFFDFSRRAKKNGAKYKIFTNCYAITNLRRYEEKGYLKTLFFWFRFMMIYLFGCKNRMKIQEKKYFNLE